MGDKLALFCPRPSLTTINACRLLASIVNDAISEKAARRMVDESFFVFYKVAYVILSVRGVHARSVVNQA